jgi:hypothetical protein
VFSSVEFGKVADYHPDVPDADPFSDPVLFIELFSKETGADMQTTGTAFLVRAGSKYLLVTNWHLLNGKKSWNHDELLHERGALPGEFKVHFRISEGGNTVLAPKKIPLYSEDRPLWIEHDNRRLPEQHRNAKLAIDVGVLDVTEQVPRGVVGEMVWEACSSFYLRPMERVAIIGYPFGLFGRDVYPIWITGTVANDFAGMPEQKYFLVDARTRHGNSGSLVLHRNPGASLNQPGGRLDRFGSTSHFLGIYSGRVFSEDSDIGIVWHWEVIEELIRKMVPAGEQSWRPAQDRGNP